jgi:hypothetical protein
MTMNKGQISLGEAGNGWRIKAVDVYWLLVDRNVHAIANRMSQHILLVG